MITSTSAFIHKQKRPQCSQAVLSTAQACRPINLNLKKKGGVRENGSVSLSFLMWWVIGLFGFFVCCLVFKSAWQRATPLCCDTVGLWPTSKAMALRWPRPWWEQLMMTRGGIWRACGATSRLLALTRGGALSLLGSCSRRPSSHRSLGGNKKQGWPVKKAREGKTNLT